MKTKPVVVVLTLVLLIGLVWGYQLSKPLRYHGKLDPADVQRIEVRETPAEGKIEFVEVSDADQQAIVRWFSQARFAGDNDDIAGPGCSYVDLVIYLRSGQRVSISDNRGGVLAVSQYKKHYFIEQPQLREYIQRHREKGGCS